jgi:hypothetical protein
MSQEMTKHLCEMIFDALYGPNSSDLLARPVPNERNEQVFWQNLASVLELSCLA